MSEVSICNVALTALGASQINSLTEDSEAARKCNALYDDARDSVLRAHPWNFALKRVKLAKLEDAPAYEYSVKHQLPSDCLRVIRADNGSINILDWKVEGREILSDYETMYIKYIARIEDTEVFDSSFKATLAAKLAAELAYPIASSRSLAADAAAKYKEELAKAKSHDAQEGSPDDVIADEWLSARE